MNGHDIVRMVFPDASDDEAHDLLWSRTGWPSFWATGNPRRDILNSLRGYKRRLGRGQVPCLHCNRVAKVPKRCPELCGPCGRALTKPKKEIPA